jgi:hypothetical protein
VVHVQRGQRVAPPGIVPGADHADLDGERARPPRHLRAARGRAAVALGVAHEAARYLRGAAVEEHLVAVVVRGAAPLAS